ncbi:MAG: hypothetical protein COX70_03910 [Flavobacteriales bacterium CG_4_10_14_0_2_um_filter_32_8]|nr:MAG: hypothetical protein COX70_03910 [Flavobacteriales bacterium CG_4_10_14_0_2_um_filter_32_8]PJB16455.1 MAG: hypothetical protein CO118_00415 [Flavobacteriales bacterium CG_4_9_14_3_um_filter_32_8]
MRLGQLARQLDIKIDKIVTFLEKEKKVTIGVHPNTKVADELVAIITSHFQPKEPKDKEVIVEKPKVIKEKVVKIEVPVSPKEPIHIATPSLKIDGPKIIGKITIPDKTQIQVEVDGVVYNQDFLDKKKKDELEAERNRIAQEKEQKKKEEKEIREKAIEQRRLEGDRQEMLKKEAHNILSVEEERKRAAEEKKMRDREVKLEQQRKQKQKEFYAKKHTIKQTPSKKPLEKEMRVQKEIEQVVELKTKLSPFKRFLKWLNT